MKTINDAINVLGEGQFYSLACTTYDYIKANYGAFDSADIIDAFGEAKYAPRDIMSAVLIYLSFSDTIVKRHRTLKDLANNGQRYWCATTKEPADHNHIMAVVKQREMELNNPVEFVQNLMEEVYSEAEIIA